MFYNILRVHSISNEKIELTVFRKYIINDNLKKFSSAPHLRAKSVSGRGRADLMDQIHTCIEIKVSFYRHTHCICIPLNIYHLDECKIQDRSDEFGAVFPKKPLLKLIDNHIFRSHF